MINEEINAEINKGDFQGKSKNDLKPLYMKRNAFNVSLDTNIYRIYKFKYFLEDIKKSEITLVNIAPAVFGDELENPLIDREFVDGKDKFTLGFLSNYFGLSWTEDDRDEKCNWDCFTHGGLGVRVKVNLGALMDKLNDTRDPYFMLHYFAGKVSYHDESAIEYWKNNSHYSEFLDSLGQLSALSLTALRNDFSGEKEIRILYSYMPNDNEFVKNNITVTDNWCKHPFDWKDVVEEVLVDYKMLDSDILELKTALNNSGIVCDISHSKVVY